MMPRPIQATLGRVLFVVMMGASLNCCATSGGSAGLAREPLEGLGTRPVARLVLQADPAVVTGLPQLAEQLRQGEQTGPRGAAAGVVGDLHMAGPGREPL